MMQLIALCSGLVHRAGSAALVLVVVVVVAAAAVAVAALWSFTLISGVQADLRRETLA